VNVDPDGNWDFNDADAVLKFASFAVL